MLVLSLKILLKRVVSYYRNLYTRLFYFLRKILGYLYFSVVFVYGFRFEIYSCLRLFFRFVRFYFGLCFCCVIWWICSVVCVCVENVCCVLDNALAAFLLGCGCLYFCFGYVFTACFYCLALLFCFVVIVGLYFL